MRRRAAITAAALLLAATPAAAHGDGAPLTPDTLWHHWNLSPEATLPVLVSGTLFLVGLGRLWRRAGVGRGVSVWRAVAFAAGVLALAVALVSPLDPLGETLFAAHMVQHGILIALAPPLLLAGRPAAVMPFALPASWRRAAARAPLLRAGGGLVRHLLRPGPATVLHAVALWAWHVPVAFDAALANSWIHVAEHASFLITGLVFWQAVVLAARSRETVAGGVAALFATMLQGMMLGTVLTVAPRPLYAWYLGRTGGFGLSALEDQQLAGVLMGAPMTLAYLAAGLALITVLLRPGRPLSGGPQPLRH